MMQQIFEFVETEDGGVKIKCVTVRRVAVALFLMADFIN